MKQLVIDRMDGKFAICTDKDQKYYAIELQELPAGAQPGSVLDITDEGELLLGQAVPEKGGKAGAAGRKKR